VDHGEADQQIARRFEPTHGVVPRALLGLRRKRVHRARHQERDDEQHDDELGERETALSSC
jgi:hypothetical protein